ncbi:DUF3109 family protein [Flavobacteriaceae bacterium]|nr:DUF3109 family protein [Flavobacteriaceae bacterium]
MLQIGKTLVSEDLLDCDFVCNISQCKGACCVQGEAGAPLEKEELQILEDNFDAIAPYLNSKGKAAIKDQGKFIERVQGEWETPLVNGKECAYTVFTDQGVAQCGIENAHKDGKLDWKKPVSCHLYPVRVQKYDEFSAVNYHHWQICETACSLGAQLKVPIYKFVKEALIRKFGKEWYEQLDQVAQNHFSQ